MKKALFKNLRRETHRMKWAFIHPVFFYLVIVGNALLIFATLIVHVHEKNINPQMPSYFDSLWWGVSTITTVGFGDIVPITRLGRVIGIILMYSGTVLFITFTSLLVTRWLSAEVERELTPLEKEILQEVREQARIEEILKRIEARLDKIEAGRSIDR
ncbi:MAG TPA: hypothetical protein DF383_07445 [Deltaproteobacteria bacterium]|nr:hypothetical protein [Deltaproteobacteria bacterium]